MLALKTQRKTQLVDSATNNTPAAIHRNLDIGYNVRDAMYGTMQKAVKDSFVETTCRKELQQL
jgi:hypothetical protein